MQGINIQGPYAVVWEDEEDQLLGLLAQGNGQIREVETMKAGLGWMGAGRWHVGEGVKACRIVEPNRDYVIIEATEI